MPKYIIKLHDEKLSRDWYLEWSTIVDAPVTYGMSMEEFRDHYQQTYGTDGMRELPERMKRVEEKGTSAQSYGSVKSTIAINRAGENESNLDEEGILEKYCRNQK
jgi:hypothetical protein